MKTKRQTKTAWRWLITTTAVALVTVTLSGAAVMPSRVAVRVRQVIPTALQQTVVCTGVVQAGEGATVSAAVPCAVGTVAVAVGDTVKQGDVLLTVDRAATLAKAADMGLSLFQSSAVSSAVPESLTAPIDGVVSAIHIKDGEWTDGQSPLVVLSDNGQREIAITVSESALPRIGVGQAVRVTGAAFAKDGYDGVLTELATSAHSAVTASGTRTVVDGVVTLEPSQVDASLLVGLSAKAAVTVERKEQALVVPFEAVAQREQQTASVYCVHGRTAYRRAVNVIGETATGLEIGGGLQEGEWIVANAQEWTDETVNITVEAIDCRS